MQGLCSTVRVSVTSVPCGCPFCCLLLGISCLILVPLVHYHISMSPFAAPALLQGWANLLLITWFLWLTIRRVPYHRTYLNIAEAFLYSWCWYAAGLALIGIYYPQASLQAGPDWHGCGPKTAVTGITWDVNPISGPIALSHLTTTIRHRPSCSTGRG